MKFEMTRNDGRPEAGEPREAKRPKRPKRSAEILAVFARHNFFADGLTPVELRTTLEDLGPTYVKIGQIMSSRTDLLPEAYCAELMKLRGNVAPLPAEVVRSIIESEAAKPLSELYAEFRDEPLGSASIAQAHYGVLADGTRVVTKVQRPGIADTMRADFELLRKLAGVANTASEDDGTGVVDLATVLDELAAVTEEELDFRIEAEHTRRFRELCIEDDGLVSCPRVIDELTTERMLTMTFVDGYSVGKRDRIEADGCDRLAIGQVILKNYLHQVLDAGWFHGDPHQGNIMLSGGVPYWIDFGMMGSVSAGTIDALQEAVFALLRKDAEALADAALALGDVPADVNRGRLVDGVEGLITRYGRVKDLSEVDLGAVMGDLTDLMTTHRIRVPGELTMLARGLATIEGVIEELCPELDLFGLLSEKFAERARARFDARAELASALESVSSAAMRSASLPLLAYDAVNNLVRGRMKVGVGLADGDDLAQDVRSAAAAAAMAVFACVLFLGSCIMCLSSMQPQVAGMPLPALVGFVFAVALGIYSVGRLRGQKN